MPEDLDTVTATSHPTAGAQPDHDKVNRKDTDRLGKHQVY